MLVHPIAPLFDKNSQVLILGSFPSVKSREVNFFYGHKQNRFWRVISSLYEKELPTTVEEKTKLILENHLALWDVIGSCDIVGSSDSTITNVTANDLSVILENCSIKRIFCNGTKSYELYNKYIFPINHIPATKLPSTSPANATNSLQMLIEKWNIIKEV